MNHPPASSPRVIAAKMAAIPSATTAMTAISATRLRWELCHNKFVMTREALSFRAPFFHSGHTLSFRAQREIFVVQGEGEDFSAAERPRNDKNSSARAQKLSFRAQREIFVAQGEGEISRPLSGLEMTRMAFAASK